MELTTPRYGRLVPDVQIQRALPDSTIYPTSAGSANRPPLTRSWDNGILPRGRGGTMERVVRKFDSFEEAEQADLEYYRSLTPEQRLDILFELVAQVNGENPPRLERVCRVVKLGED